MQVLRMAASTAVIVLVMLSACSQNKDAGKTSPIAATEIPTTAASASSNRVWMPAAIVLPQPHTVVADRGIGMRTHYLQILVKDDPTPEFAVWKDALSVAGYEVKDATGTGSLLFSGADVESGQIAVKMSQDQPGFIIQVDVTRTQ